MHRFLKSIVVAWCFNFGVFAQAETYIVKKGDTLASIARAHYGEPVFGPKGTIKNIYKLNSWAKSNPALEPGQKVKLESSKGEVNEPKVRMIPATPKAPPTAAPAPVSPLPPADQAMSPAARAVRGMDFKPKGPLPEEKALAPKEEPSAGLQMVIKETAETPPPESEASELAAAEHAGPHSYFSITANYSLITQTATENASNANFTMHSNPAWGVEFGWDHWWNSTFSTVLTYALTQMTSKETSGVSGNKIMKSASLNRAELALLNRLVNWIRFGVGAAYGDHTFLEDLAAADPHIYKVSYFNPFLLAEITAHESEHYEWLINLKISDLPAQVGSGHDVNHGIEWFGQVAMMQKFARFSMFYGLSYATENQARTDAKETRTETTLKVGALF